MKRIEFFVEGVPVPQGSKSGFIRNGKVIMVESGGNKHKQWRRKVNEAAKKVAADNELEPSDEPIKATLVFYFERPKSVKRAYPTVPPDVDKLQRAVFDSLTKVLYTDDSRIVQVEAEKRYSGTPGVNIVLEVIRDQESLFENE